MTTPETPHLAPAAPTAAHPLAGLTVLVVEDSRYASEAVRLLCLRSGARLRRADSLTAADRHLRVYRPSVLIVDAGLPDGSGIDLIARLAGARPRIPAILATSGDPDALRDACLAGADGVLPKPLRALADFQQAVLAALPADLRVQGPRALPGDTVDPDRLSLLEDLEHVVDALEDDLPPRRLDYLARFLAGLAASTGDAGLAAAAARLSAAPHRRDVAAVAGVMQSRLARCRAV